MPPTPNWASQNNIPVSKPGEMEKATKQYWEQRRALEGGKAPARSSSEPKPLAPSAGSPSPGKEPTDSQARTREDIKMMMATMPELKGMTVGNLDKRGWEIKNKDGQVVHYAN